MFPPLALGSCHSHCSRHLGHLCPRTPFHLRKILQDPSSLSSPQKPRSSPCPLRVSGLPRTQHTPCFLPRSEGAQLDCGWCPRGATWMQGTAPLQPCSLRERACHSSRPLSLIQAAVTLLGSPSLSCPLSGYLCLLFLASSFPTLLSFVFSLTLLSLSGFVWSFHTHRF